MTLLRDWSPSVDLSGWWAAEKLDGVRVRWDGAGALWARSGRPVDGPRWLLAGLPAGLELDAELWAGRGRYEDARLAAQYGRDYFTPDIRLAVFDAVVPGSYVERLQTARQAVRKAPYAFAVTVSRLGTTKEALKLLTLIQENGGEGLVVRSPADNTGYRPGRSPHALRLV